MRKELSVTCGHSAVRNVEDARNSMRGVEIRVVIWRRRVIEKTDDSQRLGYTVYANFWQRRMHLRQCHSHYFEQTVWP
jgi:hypothetical protein